MLTTFLVILGAMVAALFALLFPAWLSLRIWSTAPTEIIDNLVAISLSKCVIVCVFWAAVFAVTKDPLLAVFGAFIRGAQ